MVCGGVERATVAAKRVSVGFRIPVAVGGNVLSVAVVFQLCVGVARVTERSGNNAEQAASRPDIWIHPRLGLCRR